MPQPRRRIERSAETRRRILDASLELFLENGYEKTTTRQITQKAGILNGSLYNLFRSKDDIFSELVMTGFEDSLRESERYLPEGTSLVASMVFPLGLLIHASSRSRRVAELLATAHRVYEINRRLLDTLSEWILERDAGHELPPDSPELRLKVRACTGALGTVIQAFEKEPGTIDPQEALEVVANIYVDTFGLEFDDLEGRLREVYRIVSTEDIVICGIHVNSDLAPMANP